LKESLNVENTYQVKVASQASDHTFGFGSTAYVVEGKITLHSELKKKEDVPYAY
jgi:hypothetical protein